MTPGGGSPRLSAVSGATGRTGTTLSAAASNRIVSTDKKVLKADGLLLALNAQPVSPSDDVDVEKEYELVALG